jgi:hypothetical protein
MISGGQLGNDTAIVCVHGDLAMQCLREQAKVAVVQRQTGLVTGAFDAKN